MCECRVYVCVLCGSGVCMVYALCGCVLFVVYGCRLCVCCVCDLLVLCRQAMGCAWCVCVVGAVGVCWNVSVSLDFVEPMGCALVCVIFSERGHVFGDCMANCWCTKHRNFLQRLHGVGGP